MILNKSIEILVDAKMVFYITNIGKTELSKTRHFGKIALFIEQHQDDGLMTKLSLFPRASKHDVETKNSRVNQEKACFPQNNLNINFKIKLMIKSTQENSSVSYRYFDRFMALN